MALIGLMDCNNFFVSCERLFRPDLLGKPVAVLSSNDGCIVARSEEVKAMGVPMGLPLFQAKQLVDMRPVTLFSSNFSLYRDISTRVMSVLAKEVGECEVYSIDEAFFRVPDEVTEEELLQLRHCIYTQVGIPVSIGAASTKTLAKVASKQAKRSGGACVLTKASWQELAETFSLGSIWNLGGATEKTLRSYDILTPAQFMQQSTQWVDATFGIAGRRLQDELHGKSVYPVSANSHSVQKSIASTRSFVTVRGDRGMLEAALTYHVTHVAEKLRQKQLRATWVTVELRAGRHSSFAHRTGVCTLPLAHPTNKTVELLKSVLEGFTELYDETVPYKKAGVVVGGLLPESMCQPDLFGAVDGSTTMVQLDTVIDSVNKRLGPGTIKPGTLAGLRPETHASLCSPHYTTTWKDIPTVTA